MYELQGEKLKSNREQYRDLLMREAKEASMLHRRDLAVQCCQKAYTLSHTYDEIKEISEITVNYCTENKEEQKEENDNYLKRFENDQLCEELSENLITNIEMLIAE